jgi:hypothetical protein
MRCFSLWAKYATLEFAGVKFSSFSETERTISDILEKLNINCPFSEI